jgi:orotate phosphoribosyltransferase
MNIRDRLSALLVERSVRLGDFTLASGARSSYYIDARRTTMSAEGQVLTGKVCWQALTASGLEPTHVGGLTMGADPVAYALAHESFDQGHPLDAFSVRKQPKQHGTGQQVEGGVPSDARCLVIEDAMTSGSSALRAVDVLREHGFSVVGVLTLIDRDEGGRARVEAAGLPLIAIFHGAELLEAARADVSPGA